MAVFELKEYYNETATKLYLAQLFKKESVCYKSIYRVIGCEIEPQLYNVDSKGEAAFRNIAQHMVLFAQHGDKKGFQKYIDDVLISRFNKGDYFFSYGSAQKSDERLIMNFNEIQHAIQMMTALMGAYSYIHGVKVFAYKKTLESIKYKYDKVVVYYENKNREKIGDAIVSSGINPRALRSELSGFYDTYIVKDKPETATGYLVGIGKEVAGTSFSTENTWAALSALSGKNMAEVRKQPKETPFAVINDYKECPDAASFAQKLFLDVFFLSKERFTPKK